MSTVRVTRDHQFAYEDVPPRLADDFDESGKRGYGAPIVDAPAVLWDRYEDARKAYWEARAVLDDLLDLEQWRQWEADE